MLNVARVCSLRTSQCPGNYYPCDSTIDLTVGFGFIYSQRKLILFSKGIINNSVFISIHQSIERKFACSKGYFCLLAEVPLRNAS